MQINPESPVHTTNNRNVPTETVTAGVTGRVLILESSFERLFPWWRSKPAELKGKLVIRQNVGVNWQATTHLRMDPSAKKKICTRCEYLHN